MTNVESKEYAFCQTPTREDLRASLDRLNPGKDTTVVALVAEGSRASVPEIQTVCRQRGLSLMGGVFPGILHGVESMSEGVILTALPTLMPPLLLERLSIRQGADTHTAERLDDLPHLLGDRRGTALVFVDGLSSGITPVLTEMFHRLGDSVSYLGGGAGSLSLRPSPCVFTADTWAADAAVILLLPLSCGLGVRHGWTMLYGPMVATRTRGTIIGELNWRPALDVYTSVIARDGGEAPTAGHFFEAAQGYPFGIVKEGAEPIVRDPVGVTDGAELICVGEIPENSVIHMLKGNPDALIEAAEQAAEDAIVNARGAISHAFVIDCVSRSIFLGPRFGDEVSGVVRRIAANHPGVSTVGMLTLGEISSYGEGLLEFLNKTTVVGLLYEEGR